MHAWRGWTELPEFLDLKGLRERAVECGWKQTKALNRWLLWRDRLGRLMWFETGRVNVWVRKPGSLGRAYQLVCNGFSWTGLITDLKVLEQVLGSVRFKGAHYVFPTKQRLPSLTIDLFKRSNGVVIKVGDRSHPHAIEVQAYYPDWAERNERLLQRLNDRLELLVKPRSGRRERKQMEYVR